MASFQYGGLVEQVASTATAGGTTTLTNTSKQVQVFTGTLGQTIVLPSATTMSVGQKFEFYNESTTSLTLQFNGGASFTDAAGVSHGGIAANTSILIKLQTNGTSAGTWTATASGGTVTSVAATAPVGFSVSGSPVTTSGTLTFTNQGQGTDILNLGLNASVTSNILTMAIKQADGSTNASSSSPVAISMRSSTAANGNFNLRSITAALSQTFSVWTTLGLGSGTPGQLYLYAIDSDGSGTMKIGLSYSQLDEGSLQSTIAESFTATISNASPGVVTANGHGLNNGDAIIFTTSGSLPTGLSINTIYYVTSKATNTFQVSATRGGTSINTSSAGSGTHTVHIADTQRLASDAVYTNAPIRKIGRILVTQTTGNWAAPTEMSVAPFAGQWNSITVTAATSSGATGGANATYTWIAPNSVTRAFLQGRGGGGGGGGGGNVTNGSGGGGGGCASTMTYLNNISPGTSYLMTAGGGGNGGGGANGTGNDGTTGTDSTFGSLQTWKGGGPGSGAGQRDTTLLTSFYATAYGTGLGGRGGNGNQLAGAPATAVATSARQGQPSAFAAGGGTQAGAFAGGGGGGDSAGGTGGTSSAAAGGAGASGSGGGGGGGNSGASAGAAGGAGGEGNVTVIWWGT